MKDGRLSCGSLIRQVAALIVFYSAATAIGGALFISCIHLGLFHHQSIILYRGGEVLILAMALLAALLWLIAARLPRSWNLSGRDAICAAIVTGALLFSGLVLGPVTVDRSISIFMLSQFDRASAPLTKEDARNLFIQTYIGDWDQIGRRLKEQEISGNLEETPNGWRITAQGRSFMRIARATSVLFDADPRFVGRR